ncbi:MAG: metal-sensing transcriptional repressor [Patescibacteria group bacterium]
MRHALDPKLKSRALHRAKILKGQMEGVMKMIESEEYCPAILRQSLSIQRSLKSLDELLLENHIKSHVKHQMQSPGQDTQAIKELTEIYHLANR